MDITRKRKDLESTRGTLKGYGLDHKRVNRELNKLKDDGEINREISSREEDGLCADDLKRERDSR